MTPTAPRPYAALLLLASLLDCPSALSPMSSGPLVLDRPAAAAAANTCGRGKLLPEFYVLGEKNTATTSLSADLRSLGVVPAPVGEAKEWLFFQKYAMPEEDKMMEQWLDALPECPTERKVLADFSVPNAYTVPLPSDLAWSQYYGYSTRRNTDETSWNTPRYVKDWYAKAGAEAPRFVAMLRDPLERIQSEYYHTLPLHNCFGCMANDTFAESFALNVELLKHSPMQLSDWFWKSFYGRHVEAWLEQFDASHFAFVPFREYISIDPPAFSQNLISFLGLEGTPWKEASHENSHEARPPLDEELPPSSPSRVAFEALMAPENDRLVKALARAHRGGAWLAGYSGATGDEAQVRAWLEHGW